MFSVTAAPFNAAVPPLSTKVPRWARTSASPATGSSATRPASGRNHHTQQLRDIAVKARTIQVEETREGHHTIAVDDIEGIAHAAARMQRPHIVPRIGGNLGAINARAARSGSKIGTEVACGEAGARGVAECGIDAGYDAGERAVRAWGIAISVEWPKPPKPWFQTSDHSALQHTTLGCGWRLGRKRRLGARGIGVCGSIGQLRAAEAERALRVQTVSSASGIGRLRQAPRIALRKICD